MLAEGFENTAHFKSAETNSAVEHMPSIQSESSNSSLSKSMNQQCRHPRVQIVSRDEDAEFVECLECREVFESSEFKDMDIEEKIPDDEEA
jgi:hypothetical protein